MNASAPKKKLRAKLALRRRRAAGANPVAPRR